MKRPYIALIAAHDRNNVIGRNGELPWHLPNDLKRFKALTLGHPVLMGRRTWESIGRPLPGRRNLVLSGQPGLKLEGAEVVSTPGEAVEAVKDAPWLFVIGGEAVYAAFLPLAHSLFLTEVHTQVEGGDAFFPAMPLGVFMEVSRQSHHADDRHDAPYDFVDYERIP